MGAISFKLRFFLFIIIAAFSSCAKMYHVQVGNARLNPKSRPFEFEVYATGIKVDGPSEKADESDHYSMLQSLHQTISLAQSGPTTGYPIYDKEFPEGVRTKIENHCPNGEVTGLVVTREHRKISSISRELIRVKGQCIQ